MKHHKPTLLTIATTLALLSIQATYAAAEATLPSILPEATAAENITSKSKSGTSNFGTGLLTITSQKSKGTLTGNSLKLGSFDLLFEETGVPLDGLICTGLEDVAGSGSILVKGTFHIRDYKENNTLLTAIILLLIPVHFECEGGTSVVLTGCLAGALTPEERLTKTIIASFAANSSGKDDLIITVLNETNTATELCQLSAAKNGGTKELVVEVTKQELSGFKKGAGAEGITILAMRL